MAKILVSGLLNIETTARVKEFPIPYYPIEYPFFGVSIGVSGVAFNLAKALQKLGDEIVLCSMIGHDFTGRMIMEELNLGKIPSENVKVKLAETPSSAVLYDQSGRRQIYCDLKDIQETPYEFSPDLLKNTDAVLACNINFNRPLLGLAKEQGKLIATDVHVLSDPNDEYNRDFLRTADVLFLSDEGIGCGPRDFLRMLSAYSPARIIVIGMGSKGALMYLKESSRFVEQPAKSVGNVTNTVGAGDALFSSFMHFLVKGYEPEAALDKAQLFAAMKIRFSGAAVGFPGEEELTEPC